MNWFYSFFNNLPPDFIRYLMFALIIVGTVGAFGGVTRFVHLDGIRLGRRNLGHLLKNLLQLLVVVAGLLVTWWFVGLGLALTLLSLIIAFGAGLIVGGLYQFSGGIISMMNSHVVPSQVITEQHGAPVAVMDHAVADQTITGYSATAQVATGHVSDSLPTTSKAVSGAMYSAQPDLQPGVGSVAPVLTFGPDAVVGTADVVHHGPEVFVGTVSTEEQSLFDPSIDTANSRAYNAGDDAGDDVGEVGNRINDSVGIGTTSLDAALVGADSPDAKRTDDKRTGEKLTGEKLTDEKVEEAEIAMSLSSIPLQLPLNRLEKRPPVGKMTIELLRRSVR